MEQRQVKCTTRAWTRNSLKPFQAPPKGSSVICDVKNHASKAHEICKKAAKKAAKKVLHNGIPEGKVKDLEDRKDLDSGLLLQQPELAEDDIYQRPCVSVAEVSSNHL